MSRLKMSCVPSVHCHISVCLVLVEVFAIPGEPCYQILKMLSSPPRLPTTVGDMSPSPSYSLTFFSLLSLLPNVRAFFKLAFQVFLSSFPHDIYITITITIIYPHVYYCIYYLLQVFQGT